MKIRFAKPEDTLAILKLLEQIGKVHYDLRPDIFQSHAQKYGASQVLDRLANPETPTFVAVEGEKVLGYSFCEIKTFSQHPVMKDRKEMFLEDLCVDESVRGQGVGKALYEYVCKYAREEGCHNLTLHVWSDNAGAVAFYEKMGMKPQRHIMETILEEA
jgi:ribosomal protein S18 acetylase RimI-like enzyme